VPLSVISYSQLRPDQNNRTSSLTNFFGNWGGSFGSRWHLQVHQSNLGSAFAATSQQFAERTHALADYLIRKGIAVSDHLKT
jgi:DHA2 family multidrug resistance protein